MNPGSVMRLGNCALVPGQHTVTFSSVAAQQQAFTTALGNSDYYDGLLFIRTDQGKVTIQNYAPTIFNCNYLMYRNAGDEKWYYAFVVQVVYVNENVCDVYFEIDPLQTYMFDYTRNACMVIREHTNDDTIGANIMEEPVGTGELKILYYTYLNHAMQPDTAMDEYVAFAFSAQDAEGESAAKNAGVLDGCYTGCAVYYANMEPFWWDGTDIYTGMENWLYEMSDGHQAAISNIVLFPKMLCDDLPESTTEIHTLFDSTRRVYNSRQYNITPISRPNPSLGIDGYKPRNMKLYTYPYCFARVSNNKGQYHDYRWEFFGGQAAGTFGFTLKGTINPAGDVFCSPISYNSYEGPLFNYEEKVSLGGLIQIPWPYNSFNNWLGQNAASVAVNLLEGAVMLIPGGRIIGGAAKAGMAAARMGVERAAQTAGRTFSQSQFVRNSVSRAVNDPANQFAFTGAALGAAQIANTTAQLIDQSNAPDRMVGASTSNALSGLGLNAFSFFSLGVRAEFAAMIDDYFDQYGYATNAIKTPNETGRASWNYVQTSGACFTGDVPAPYMREINAMYDAGITFWHDLSYVGDYNRDNSIV